MKDADANLIKAKLDSYDTNIAATEKHLQSAIDNRAVPQVNTKLQAVLARVQDYVTAFGKVRDRIDAGDAAGAAALAVDPTGT